VSRYRRLIKRIAKTSMNPQNSSMIRRASAKHSFDKLRRYLLLKLVVSSRIFAVFESFLVQTTWPLVKLLDDWSSKQTDQRRAQYRDVDAALHAQALRRGIEFLTIIRLAEFRNLPPEPSKKNFDAVEGFVLIDGEDCVSG
jgi:hypothetical protein